MFYFQALTALKEEGEGGEEKKQSLALCRAHPFGTWGHRWSTRPCCGRSSVLLLHPCLHLLHLLSPCAATASIPAGSHLPEGNQGREQVWGAGGGGEGGM